VNLYLFHHYHLSNDDVCQPCQVQQLFKKIGYTTYFGVDHHNMGFERDVGLKLKEQVQTLFVDHQHSLASQTPTLDVCALSFWLLVFH
jgi:hypothetical protein